LPEYDLFNTIVSLIFSRRQQKGVQPKLKKISIIISVFLFLGISIVFCVYMDLMIYADRPAEDRGPAKVVNVPAGRKFKDLCNDLYQARIIRQPNKFEQFARIQGLDKHIKAGEYELSADMPPRQIIEILVSGRVRLHKITVPEGYNLRQIAALIDQSGCGTQSGFLKAATDPARVRKMGISAQTFEGYLFPDTYYFPKNIQPKKIIETMVNRFQSVFKPEWKNRAQAMGFSVHAIVTLASIIEKETGVAAERPIISSVFHNRLKRNMRLDSDPTVIYGIKDFDGNITRKHLATPSPYNTYMISGLPPGPIANPGVKALEAALYPANTDFLYFVSKKDHTHQFSTRISDHLRAVKKYQLHR
jgi:UPF0755 protein